MMAAANIDVRVTVSAPRLLAALVMVGEWAHTRGWERIVCAVAWAASRLVKAEVVR